LASEQSSEDEETADERPTGRDARRTLWALIAVETLCVLGAEIAVFGVSVWLYEATHSVYAYGGLLFASTVPGLLIAPVAGHVVDKYPRKRVMIGASLVTLFGSLIVLGCALLGHLSIIPLLVGAAIASVGEAFQWPALASTLPQLASEHDLPKYNGFLESGKAASVLAGPVIGGATFALVGLKGLLAIDIVAFAAGTAIVAVLALPSGPGDEDEEEEASAADLLFGLRWIFRHKPLFKILCAAVFANFFLSVGNVLMAPYCLGLISEQGYGIASGCFGAGMILGGIVYGRIANRFRNGRIFIVSALALGVLYSFFGFARSLPSLAAVEFGLAVLVTLAKSALLTIWQLKVPEKMSGRVLSAMWMVEECTTPLAFLLAGPIGDSLVPFVLAHAGGGARWVGATWGTSKSGEIGMLFSAIGVILCVGFAVAARSKEVREVEDCPI
jgi:DHA3 family macrolide efflux protein-like MFS transporter